jgi:hypothetical protein
MDIYRKRSGHPDKPSNGAVSHTSPARQWPVSPRDSKKLPGGARKKARHPVVGRRAWSRGSGDDRLSRLRTIMGLAGLTAVFGMGTGGAPPVSSPELGRGAVRLPRPRWIRCQVTHAIGRVRQGGGGFIPDAGPAELGVVVGWGFAGSTARRPSSGDGGGESGWSSRLAVRTGRLRRSPAVHSRPIDLVVFQEPSDPAGHGNLVLKRASRLDAFSAYPFPTWLPGDAPSGTAGTPEVGPPQSSRTRGDPSQVSYAHGR